VIVNGEPASSHALRTDTTLACASSYASIVYGEEADISPASATNDFRRLLDAGLLTHRERGRSIRYHASDGLREQVAQVLRTADTREDASA